MYLKLRRALFKQILFMLVFLLLPKHSFSADTSSLDIIARVQDDLFPKREGVPTLEQINATQYLKLVLQQKRVTQEHKNFIFNGAKWLNEEAVLLYKMPYSVLAPQQRQNVLHAVAKESWGESWINTVLTYIYEALLCDPVYGGNRDSIGWTWLHHTPGLPRPKKALV